ncbi:hypothetical protein O181_059940 [Austropuccinia psidii MF-1]|uniref:Uncharacterized protein n=1 Tax=Austropuccinia psidii MF-1 TaxID=1389203 RepID=A0A9Q3HZ59_9BASI|nr:hypothetical protein [Austropuccinia psidii MF-1]
MEHILKQFCAYGMEYKDHEGYTHYWVTLLPEVQLAYSTIKPYSYTEKDKFPLRKKNPTPPEIVELNGSPEPVKKIIKARKIRLNGKDQRQYLVRFKNQTADKDKWLEEYAIPDGKLHLKRFRASRRSEKSHK